jgi:hypothetical protein
MASTKTQIEDTRVGQEQGQIVAATGKKSKVSFSQGNVSGGHGSTITVQSGLDASTLTTILDRLTQTQTQSIEKLAQAQTPETPRVPDQSAPEKEAAAEENKPLADRIRAFVIGLFGVEEENARKIITWTAITVAAAWLWLVFRKK